MTTTETISKSIEGTPCQPPQGFAHLGESYGYLENAVAQRRRTDGRHARGTREAQCDAYGDAAAPAAAATVALTKAAWSFASAAAPLLASSVSASVGKTLDE